MVMWKRVKSQTEHMCSSHSFLWYRRKQRHATNTTPPYVSETEAPNKESWDANHTAGHYSSLYRRATNSPWLPSNECSRWVHLGYCSRLRAPTFAPRRVSFRAYELFAFASSRACRIDPWLRSHCFRSMQSMDPAGRRRPRVATMQKTSCLSNGIEFDDAISREA
jgi:hypothetical protein